jgi:hypothetical protein
MNIRWKIAIHIAVTLLIGILIGALLNRTLVQRRLRHLLEMRTIGLLALRPERNLNPITPEQEKQIREILDKHAERLAEIHQRFDREIQSAFDSLSKEIDPILTPEQRDQFKRMVPGPPPFPNRPEHGFPFMGRRGSPPFEIETLRRELNLSQEQAEKVKAILQELWSQAPRPGQRPEVPGVADALQEIRKKVNQEIEKVLTDDQKEKFRQFMKRRGPRPEDDKPLRQPSPL